MLERINVPHDVAGLSVQELGQLADEIRGIILDTVINHGGHLASNLGVVELTLALNYVFDQDVDKILFDVGHQCYTHKILTGRVDAFKSSLRETGGISGFPNLNESKYDLFTVGHSGSSISQAAGLAKTRDLLGENYSVISVVGDASLTTGLSFEAMNNIGKTKQIIVLNDNNMSISKNVGAVSKALTALRNNNAYKKFKKKFLNAVSTSGIGDVDRLSVIKRIKNGVKYACMDGILFEEFGLKYIGPVDGHNMSELINCLNIAKDEEKSVLVHVVTKKGRGCIEAENEPHLYHGVSRAGSTKSSRESFSSAFGRILTDRAGRNDKVVALCAAMAESTGLSAFKKTFPDRFIDVGIAEEHAVSCSGGIAKGGFKPFLALYSSFLQRSYDEILEDVALQNLPVTFCVDRAGLVGEDGETHHGIFDLAMLSSIPGMTVLSPATIGELEEMIDFALSYNKPLAIRYGKAAPVDCDYGFTPFKWSVVKGNADAKKIILAHGASMIAQCLSAIDGLADACLVNCNTVFPLDKEFLSSLYDKEVYVFEDCVSAGCLGAGVVSYFSDASQNVKVICKNLGDSFVPHGRINELLEKKGLDWKNIKSIIMGL